MLYHFCFPSITEGQILCQNTVNLVNVFDVESIFHLSCSLVFALTFLLLMYLLLKGTTEVGRELILIVNL